MPIRPEPRGGTRRRRASALAALGLLAAGAIAAAGGTADRALRAAIRTETHRRLAPIAEPKAAQARTWIADRRTGAPILVRHPTFLERVRQPRAADAPAAALDSRLALLRERSGDVSVVPAHDAGRLPAGAGGAGPPLDRAALAASARQPGVRLADFSPAPARAPPGGRIERGLFARLPLPQPAPILSVRIDPPRFPYPSIQRRARAVRTGETLPGEREGDRIVALGELREPPGSVLRLRLPLADSGAPAARTLLGERGVFAGIGSRGVPALGSPLAIPDAPRETVSKIDAREASTALDELTAVAVPTLVVTILGVWIARWVRRRGREASRRALAERFGDLGGDANDAIFAVDAQGRIREANERCPSQYGYSREAFLRLRLDDLRGAGESARLAPLWARLPEHPSLIYETVHRRRDGTLFPVECSVRRIEREDGTALYRERVKWTPNPGQFFPGFKLWRVPRSPRSGAPPGRPSLRV